MDFIEEVLVMSKISGKCDVFSTFLAALFFFGVGILLFIFFNSSSIMIPMFIIGCIFAPIIGYTLGMKISRIIFKKIQRVDFEKSKLYKILKKQGDLSSFTSTINDEINSENAIKYSDKFFGVGLIVTKTWFVYIEKTYPIVIKTNDIVKISEEVANSAKTFLAIELKDKTFLRIDEIDYSDIELEIRNKYPNIEIGVEIIDEYK